MRTIRKRQRGYEDSLLPDLFRPETWTNAQSATLPLPMLLDTGSVTGLPGLEDGPALCASLDGLTTSPSGPAHAHASHSAPPASSEGPATNGTCGRNSCASSRSAGLSASLASRLQMRLASVGSMEYQQTWKRKATPSGRLYWAHIASARPISDSGCGGCPTPTKGNADGSQMAKDAGATGRRPDGSKATVSLNAIAALAGWATPSSRDWKDSPGQAQDSFDKSGKFRNRIDQLARQAMNLAGWATPKAADGRGESYAATENRRSENRKLAHGAISPSSPAPTEKRGALAPAFSRWLMGYPEGWLSCVDWAMLSCRKLPRSS